MKIQKIKIVPWRNHYTFDFLSNTPDFSLAGKDFLGIPAVKTFEGEPWEVFEANGFVYNFSTGSVEPIQSIAQQVTIKNAGNRYLSNGLILPGSITDDGQRVKDYSAWYSRDTLSWLYSEVVYV